MAKTARVLAVSSTIVKLWVREVASATGTSIRTVKVGAGVSLVLASFLGALLALVAASHLEGDIPSELRAAALRASFSGAALTGGAIGVVLCMSVPSRTALQNLIDLLPIDRVTARLGQIVPLFTAGLVYSLALSMSGIAIVVRTTTSVWIAVGGVAAYIALVIVALAFSIGVFSVAQYASARLLRLPPQYAATLGGAAALVITLAATVPDILSSQPVLEFTWGIGEVLPARVFAWVAYGQPGAIIGATLWGAVAASLVWFGAKLRTPSSRNRQPRWLHGMKPLGRSAGWGHVWFEMLIAVRNPQFTMTVLLVPATLGGVYALTLVPAVSALAGQLGLSVAVFPMMLALYSGGRTLPSAWVGRVVGSTTAVRVIAKSIAIVMTSGLLSCCIATVLLASRLVQPADLGDLVARCVLALGLALAVGTLIPYSEQQPLSIVAGGFVLAVGYLLITLSVGMGTQGLAPGTSTAILLAAALAALGAYALLSARALRSGPVRA